MTSVRPRRILKQFLHLSQRDPVRTHHLSDEWVRMSARFRSSSAMRVSVFFVLGRSCGRDPGDVKRDKTKAVGEVLLPATVAAFAPGSRPSATQVTTVIDEVA